MRSARGIGSTLGLLVSVALLLGACGDEDKPKADRPVPRARPVPPPAPAPAPERPPDPPPAVEPAPSLEPALSQWWCLCYRREGAEGPEPVTACREIVDQCHKLEQRVAKGSDEIIAGSLTHGCRPITGQHPGDVAGTREQWQPSKLHGAWVAEGACLLASDMAPAEAEPEPVEPPPTEVDDLALMRSELIGDLALGRSSADIRHRHGEPNKTGAIEESAATGSWDQTWTYDNGLVLIMSSTTRSGPQSLSAVSIEAPSTLQTRRGIGIGDSREAVERAYGDVRASDWESDDESFVAGSIYGGLNFSFENGAVTRIFLGASAE